MGPYIFDFSRCHSAFKMAKKKKSSLKPVARPFATTSIAKKVVDTQPEETIEESSVKEPEESSKDTNAPKDTHPPADDYDIDRAEIESLQLLVDQQQAKAEREALRLIKVSLKIRRVTW